MHSIRQSQRVVLPLTHANRGIQRPIREPQASSVFLVWRKKGQQGHSCSAHSAGANVCRDGNAVLLAARADTDQRFAAAHVINKRSARHTSLLASRCSLCSCCSNCCFKAATSSRSTRTSSCSQTCTPHIRISRTSAKQAHNSKESPHAACRAVAGPRTVSLWLRRCPFAPAQAAFPQRPRRRAHCGLPSLHSPCPPSLSLHVPEKKSFRNYKKNI